MPPGLERLIGEVIALQERIESEPPRCREFRLYRHTDAAGLARAEVLAVGVLFPSGRAVMEFCAAPDLNAVRSGIDEIVAAYCGDGRTELVFLD